jgi:hypothetical protein
VEKCSRALPLRMKSKLWRRRYRARVRTCLGLVMSLAPVHYTLGIIHLQRGEFDEAKKPRWRRHPLRSRILDLTIRQASFCARRAIWKAAGRSSKRALKLRKRRK